jgi:hypothetical protein
MKEIEGISKIMKDKGFDVTGFAKLAFKPVVVTLGISMAFIISLLMKQVITIHQTSFQVAGTTIQSLEVNNNDPKTYRTSIDN